MVKIQVHEHPERASAMLAISCRARVDCYPDHIYVLPEPALDVLKEFGVTYREPGRGGFDFAQLTLRDALAAGTKRRA
jgi:hypothetical protein